MSGERQQNPLPADKAIFDLVCGVSQIIVGSQTLAELGDKITETICDAFRADACIIRMLESRRLRLAAQRGMPPGAAAEYIDSDVGIAARMIAERIPVLVQDPASNPTTAELHERAVKNPRHFVFTSYAGAPLVVRDEVIGLIGIYSTSENRRFSDVDLQHLLMVANQVGVALMNHRLFQEMERQNLQLIIEAEHKRRTEDRMQSTVLYDSLTGLPRLPLLMEYLRRDLAVAKESGRGFTLVHVDCDRLSSINETLGHDIGDQLLIQVSQRLQDLVGAGDIVARIEGDRFCLLLEGVRTDEQARAHVVEILHRLEEGFRIKGHQIHATFSVGICSSQSGGNSAEEFLHNAEIAMRRAKKLGRGQVQVFQPRHFEQQISSMTLEVDLRRAFDTGELFTHFHPIVSLGDGQVVGFEALARWSHPVRGLIPSSRFVAIAEEVGLIRKLGWNVLEESIRQAVKWRLLCDRPLFVSVNISGHQMRQRDLPARLERLLCDLKLPPAHLKLEVTESVVMDQSRTAADVLMQLKEIGIQILIDDFGTGYSSLSFLHRMPFSCLKIDRSFVARIDKEDGRCLVDTIVRMAQSLRMEIIAEGVESTAQQDALRELGVDMVQGYLFALPMNAAEVADFLKKPSFPVHTVKK